MIFLVNNYLFRKKIGYYDNGDSNMDEKLEKVREMDNGVVYRKCSVDGILYEYYLEDIIEDNYYVLQEINAYKDGKKLYNIFGVIVDEGREDEKGFFSTITVTSGNSKRIIKKVCNYIECDRVIVSETKNGSYTSLIYEKDNEGRFVNKEYGYVYEGMLLDNRIIDSFRETATMLDREINAQRIKEKKYKYFVKELVKH